MQPSPAPVRGWTRGCSSRTAKISFISCSCWFWLCSRQHSMEKERENSQLVPVSGSLQGVKRSSWGRLIIPVFRENQAPKPGGGTPGLRGLWSSRRACCAGRGSRANWLTQLLPGAHIHPHPFLHRPLPKVLGTLSTTTYIVRSLYWSNMYKDFVLPMWHSGQESTCQCRRHGFVGKILWSKKWQPTPVFLLGKFHGQRSLVGCMQSMACRVGHEWATEHVHRDFVYTYICERF